MKKIELLIILFVMMSSCKIPTTSTDDPIDLDGASRLSNAGFFTIYANTYGMVLDRHLSESDAFWLAVSDCMSVDPNRLSMFKILLEDSVSFACGKDDNGNVSNAAGCYFNDSRSVETRSRIAVLGGPELIFPDNQNYPLGFREMEYKRIWRHELVHLGFAMRGDDFSHENGSPLWACQCPPEYTDCFTWGQNTQMRMGESIKVLH